MADESTIGEDELERSSDELAREESDDDFELHRKDLGGGGVYKPPVEDPESY